MAVEFQCDNCGGLGKDKASEYAKKRRHFCKRQCYTEFRETKLPKEEQHAWKGGITPAESRKRWREKNTARLAAIAKVRAQRELDAPGSHTQQDWDRIKQSYNNECAEIHGGKCAGKLTKDHITPLVMGGTQNPDNLQPLCSRHNAAKGAKVALNFELDGDKLVERYEKTKRRRV